MRWFFAIGLMWWSGWVSAQDLPKAAQQWSIDQQAIHVANRLGYGITPALLNHIKTIGISAYIEQQLNPSELPLAALPNQPIGLYASAAAGDQLLQQFTDYQADPELVRQGQPLSVQRQKMVRQKTAEYQQAKLLRAIYSPRQLEERLVDFWFNHFNVFAGVDYTGLLIQHYEDTALRPVVFGRFSDLLQATAQHAAMSTYLNNRVNRREQTFKNGHRVGINENYARELLELHTVGLDAGYTQADIRALAQVLTGWGFDITGQRNRPPLFYFDAKQHQAQPQVVLGQTIGADVGDGEQFLAWLAGHPLTAQRMSHKLAVYFVADQPPAPLVAQMTQTFLQSQGDLSAVLRVMFYSDAFWSRQSVQQKFKTPYEYVVSSVRLADVQPQNVRYLVYTLQQMNMPIYGCLTPDGYPATAAAWKNAYALSQRFELAKKIGGGVIALDTGVVASVPDVRHAQRQRFQPDANRMQETIISILSDNTTEVLRQAPKQMRAGLLLSSPEFLYQ